MTNIPDRSLLFAYSKDVVCISSHNSTLASPTYWNEAAVASEPPEKLSTYGEGVAIHLRALTVL